MFVKKWTFIIDPMMKTFLKTLYNFDQRHIEQNSYVKKLREFYSENNLKFWGFFEVVWSSF